MRILVAIKRILDPSGMVVNRRRERIFINREEYFINPADRHALEMALQLKDREGAEVIVVSRGSARPGAEAQSDASARWALAMGADRAIHLQDEALLQADGTVIARVLAAVVERLGAVDLVLMGRQALDGMTGEEGPRLAEVLGWPSVVGAVALEPVNGSLRVVTRSGEGFQGLEVPLPALVTVDREVNKPRYPQGRRLINVYRDPEAVEHWTAEMLGLEVGQLTPLVRSRGRAFPAPRTLGSRAESVEELAQALARYISPFNPLGKG